jgi:hypothetical protein
MPILQERPTDYQVAEGIWYRCYRREDAVTIVVELQAACLALSGDGKLCQTEGRHDENIEGQAH